MQSITHTIVNTWQQLGEHMSDKPEKPLSDIAEPSAQINFDQKANIAIDVFGESLEKTNINLAFCVVFDPDKDFEPKVFYRGSLVDVTKHTSKVLNAMRFKLINELNGNF